MIYCTIECSTPIIIELILLNVLQDGTFSVGDFSEALQEHEVQRVMKAYADSITMNIHCADAGLWHTLPEKPFAKLCKLRINPGDVLNTNNQSIIKFIGKLSYGSDSHREIKNI